MHQVLTTNSKPRIARIARITLIIFEGAARYQPFLGHELHELRSKGLQIPYRFQQLGFSELSTRNSCNSYYSFNSWLVIRGPKFVATYLSMFAHLSRGVKKFWAALALLSVEMAIVVILFIIALSSFVYIARRIFVLNETELDRNVFAFLRTYVSERNNDLMQFFTFLGKHDFLIPANLILIAYFLFIKKHRWYSIKVPAIALSSLGLMFLLKNLFGRPRPEIPLLFEAEGLSFPSGHALMSVTFYGLLIYIVYKSKLRQWLRWTLMTLLLILIVIIGFSRIYLRVHYTSDVIAGFCTGFLWLAFSVWLLNRMEQYSRRKLNKVVEQPPEVEKSKVISNQ